MYQGVEFRSAGDPVLYLSNPKGIDATARRKLIDSMQELNRMQLGVIGDPEITARFLRDWRSLFHFHHMHRNNIQP